MTDPTPDDWTWYTARLAAALRRAMDAELELTEARAHAATLEERLAYLERVTRTPPAPAPSLPVGSPETWDGPR